MVKDRNKTVAVHTGQHPPCIMTTVPFSDFGESKQLNAENREGAELGFTMGRLARRRSKPDANLPYDDSTARFIGVCF